MIFESDAHSQEHLHDPRRRKGVRTLQSQRSRRLFAFENRLHLLVGEAFAIADSRRGRSGAHRFAVGGKLHLGRHHIADLAFLQAGQAVRDDLREHRDHTLRQIDAGAAFACFAIERPAYWHEVRNVGNVNGELPVAGVEIALAAKPRRQSPWHRPDRS